MSLLSRSARSIAKGHGLLVVAFGSSTTEGVGASAPYFSYPSVLERELRAALPTSGVIRVLNHGVGGENAADMSRRVERDAIRPDPDLVIWQTGVNDALRGDPIEAFVAQTRADLSRIREAGIDVALMEPQWCPLLNAAPASGAFLMAVRDLAKELDAPLYKRFDLMREWADSGVLPAERMIVADGLHLTDECYQLIGRTLAADLMTWMNLRPPTR